MDLALTPTTYGSEIQPPSPGCVLLEDCPGDDLLDIFNLKIIPILQGAEKIISFPVAVSRSRDWGQRAALALLNAGNTEKIPESVWTVGQYVICGGTVWQGSDCEPYVWCVIRDGLCFRWHYCRWFLDSVFANGRRIAPRK